ncbi:MAG TPA: enoyl-CoA hydratase/isomerase family protein [Acidimicrobiales bacterium]|jgi:enoyl-CoA hydratase/carnithine racemase|nr:enoyl-CoA hydratase/isomerase family protein [Acidimicrobiales bacterium]
MTRYDQDGRYRRWVRFERSDEGILLVQLHDAGSEFTLTHRSHGAIADAFADVARDRDLSVVIFTGTGPSFMDRWGGADPDREFPERSDPGAELLDETGWVGAQLHRNLLDVQVPVIAAVNGACTTHSELPLMCDIVLAAEHAYFEDGPHFPRGVVPGDGVHTVWPMVVGHNRARHFLLGGQRLSAREAQQWGAVNEVLPGDELLPRAWEIARYLAMRPRLTLRSTRSVLIQPFRRAATADLASGVYQELYAMRGFLSWRGGQQPLDRRWDDHPWPGAPGSDHAPAVGSQPTAPE